MLNNIRKDTHEKLLFAALRLRNGCGVSRSACADVLRTSAMEQGHSGSVTGERLNLTGCDGICQRRFPEKRVSIRSAEHPGSCKALSKQGRLLPVTIYFFFFFFFFFFFYYYFILFIYFYSRGFLPELVGRRPPEAGLGFRRR